MKKFKLVLTFLFLFTISAINSQNKDKEGPVTCNVNSNFDYSFDDCNTLDFITNSSSNSTTTIIGYFWDFGNGQTSTQQNPSNISYSNNGSYTVELTVIGFNSSSGDCCTNAISKIINIITPQF